MAGVAHGEKGKRKYSQHGAYGNDKPQLLAHDAEHGVRIAGKGVFKPAVSGSLAEKAARCAGGKGVRLLIAAVPDVLGVPYMPPGCKSARNVVFHLEHKEACHARSRYCERYRCY